MTAAEQPPARHGRTGPYRDRAEAGRALAAELGRHRGPGTIVLGLPRGGVPVAAEVARVLGAPLDVIVVRKLGVPGQRELAMGAVAGVGGHVEVVRNEAVLAQVGVGPGAFDRVLRAEVEELHRREVLYRGERRPPEVEGRTVVVVDDGLATGSTMRAALTALRRRDPARIVIVVPVAATSACAAFAHEVDEVVCGWTPEPFHAVGQAYADFAPTSDEEVHRLLADG